ncbi:acyl-CoA dehydrogenase family protein [Saccharopolyspora sp. NPDC050642]|uniref:acyl-CoA dehydrogenase family protein n=1 Tax=Saccharopolyspora sp. NPDC050642 TaxID=3157099 RepID=UPI0033F7E86D
MSDNTELAAFRAEVRDFIAAELPADLRRKVIEHRRLEKQDFLRWQGILQARGWAAPNWPVSHGGAGWTPAQRQIFDEEAAIAGAPETPPFGLRMVGPVLLKYGTPQQRERYLPRILTGEDWWCQGYSEPGSGSDLASLKLRADRDGDHFVLNGQKTWTTYAQYADMMFCLARTDSGGKPQEGISFLLVDMRSPGVTVRPIRTIDGDTEINDVFFDDVRVPVDNLVGELGGGWTCAKFLLAQERFGAARVGRAKRELAILQRIAAQRVVDGVPLSTDPVFAARLARLEIDGLALQETNLRLTERVLADGGLGIEASVLRLLGADLAQRITEQQVEVAGVHGIRYPDGAFSLDGAGVGPDWAEPLAGFHLNLRKISIYGGTNEIQRNIIAKILLDQREGSWQHVDLQDEQRAIAEAVGSYLDREYPPPPRTTLEPAHWKSFAEMGLLGLAAEDSGADASTTAVVLAEFGSRLVDEPYVSTAVLGARLLASGLPGQRACDEILPEVVAGERIVALAHGEAQTDHNPHSVETRAVRTGDGWSLTGQKIVVIDGGRADHFIVSARTSGEAAAEAGISLFLVDRDQTGLDLRDYPTIDGRRGTDLRFADLHLPETALIGAPDQAFPVLDEALDAATAALCAEAVGVMSAVLDLTTQYIRDRRQFGSRLADFQVIRHRWVDMLLALEQARSLAWLAARHVDDADQAVRARMVSAAKVGCVEAGRLLRQQGIQLHGAIGMTDELALGHYVKRLFAIEHTFGGVRHHLTRFAENS